MSEKFIPVRIEGGEMRIPSKSTKIEFLCDGKIVLTLTKERIFAAKDVEVDVIAKAVFDALESRIKDLQSEPPK